MCIFTTASLQRTRDVVALLGRRVDCCQRHRLRLTIPEPWFRSSEGAFYWSCSLEQTFWSLLIWTQWFSVDVFQTKEIKSSFASTETLLKVTSHPLVWYGTNKFQTCLSFKTLPTSLLTFQLLKQGCCSNPALIQHISAFKSRRSAKAVSSSLHGDIQC